MRIKSLTVRDGLLSHSYEFDNVTVVFSRHNKAGKTTLLRCILYALGYPIPSMKGFELGGVEFTISISAADGNDINLRRIGATVELSRPDSDKVLKFSLPALQNDLHKIIFGIDNEIVLNNLLGAFYFDQEKGWTLLNRGKVIGSIHFSIEDFLLGIIGRPITEERNRLTVIKDEIRKYKYMLNVAQYQLELSASGDAVPFDTPAEEIMREISRLRNKRKPLENEARRLRGTIRGNEDFRKYIDSMCLRVEVPNREPIPVTSKNLVGFSDTKEYLHAKLSNVQAQIASIDNQISQLEGRQTKTESLVTVQTSIQRFAEELSHVVIDAPSVERILASLTKQRKEIEGFIRNILIRERTVVDSLSKSVIGYLNEFGIDPRFGSDIFTHDLKSFSGTIFHLQVFAFTISYAKLVRERTGCVLPLIIDSPNGREVEKDTVDKMLSILLRDFSNHQIIIATIYDPMLPSQKTINLVDGVVNFPSNRDTEEA